MDSNLTEIEQTKTRVLSLMDSMRKGMLEHAWEIGAALITLKRQLPFGEFGPFLKQAKITPAVAHQWRKLAANYGKDDLLARFPNQAQAIAALPKPETPPKPDKPDETPDKPTTRARPQAGHDWATLLANQLTAACRALDGWQVRDFPGNAASEKRIAAACDELALAVIAVKEAMRERNVGQAGRDAADKFLSAIGEKAV